MTVVEGSDQEYINVPALGQFNCSLSSSMTGLTVNGQSIVYNVQTTVLLSDYGYVKIKWYIISGQITVDLIGVG